MNLETQVIQALGGFLVASISAGIAVVTPKIKSFLEAHTTAKTAKVASDLVDGLSKIAESVVSDFNQRIVNDAKTKNAWTPELAQQTKKDAIESVKMQAIPFLSLAKKTTGEIEPLIPSLIEQAVLKLKIGGK